MTETLFYLPVGTALKEAGQASAAEGRGAGQALRLRVQAEQPERYRQVRPLPRAGNQDGEAWKGAIGLIFKIFVAIPKNVV
jgi:hypothetical protein